jgi:hypothetical protein
VTGFDFDPNEKRRDLNFDYSAQYIFVKELTPVLRL